MLSKIAVKCHNKTKLFEHFLSSIYIAGLSNAKKTKQVPNKMTELWLYYMLEE